MEYSDNTEGMKSKGGNTILTEGFPEVRGITLVRIASEVYKQAS